MPKETPPVIPPPPFSQFLLWEILGLVGFLHILQYGPANDPTPLLFLANSILFILTYPLLFFYNQLRMPPFMKMLVRPVGTALRVVLMVCGFFWLTYICYASGFLLGQSPCFGAIKSYWMLIAPFYAVNYYFFLEHLLGVSAVAFSFWVSVGMVSDSVSGLVGGYYLGRTLDSKWGMFFGGPDVRALIWIIFILVGISTVVWFGNKTRKG